MTDFKKDSGKKEIFDESTSIEAKDKSPEKEMKKETGKEVEIKKENHRVLLERYDQRLKDLDPELITPEDEIALKEAFIHAKETFEPEELVSWFIVKAEPFYRSVSWKVLLPFYEELLGILEKKPGPESPETAYVLNGLAGIYRYMGNYEEALGLLGLWKKSQVPKVRKLHMC